MIDESVYAVVCRKGQENDPDKVLYFAPRQILENVKYEAIDLIPLTFPDIEGGVLKNYRDEEGNPFNFIVRMMMKSELVEL